MWLAEEMLERPVNCLITFHPMSASTGGWEYPCLPHRPQAILIGVYSVLVLAFFVVSFHRFTGAK